MEQYFVIYNSDGDTRFQVLDKATLMKRIDENYYGRVQFADRIPDIDSNYWGEQTVVIKGSIIMPDKAWLRDSAIDSIVSEFVLEECQNCGVDYHRRSTDSKHTNSGLWLCNSCRVNW
jgi:hypothetical protein